MELSVQFGSRKIDFTVDFVDRKTLGITVTPEMAVLVKAPLDAPTEKILEKVKRKAPWIIKQLSFFLSFHPKTRPKKFINGESHLYLGRQYRLKTEVGKTNSIKINGAWIEVVTQNQLEIEDIVRSWYLKQAKLKFNEYAAPLIEKFKKYDVAPSGLVLRDMPTRWGSCTPKGKIILNPELIKAPKGCIEYVIVHELCHLIHRDHTQRFFDLQTKEFPTWEKWKERLEKLMA